MVAPLGNKFRQVLKTEELRKEAYRQYCNHLAQGYHQDSWYFEHPELTLCSESMEKYIKEYPQELAPINKRVAKAKGLKIWEKVVEDSAKGDNEKANTASLQMLMRNKFGWDKPEKDKQASDAEIRINLKEFAEELGQGRAERTAKRPSNHNAKPADSDVFPPSAHKFE